MGQKAFNVSDLSPRQRQVVILIGRGCNYRTAAAKLKNRFAVQSGEDDPPTISPRTVEQYAAEIRDLMGEKGSPLRAVLSLYYDYREELEHAA